jgi:hypothetical protein
MNFKSVDKTGIVADSDPNSVTPTRTFLMNEYCCSQSREPTRKVAIRTRVMNGAALVGAGTVSFQLWAKDDATGGPWIKVGAAVATLANDTLQTVDVPAVRGFTGFLQVTAVAGAGATDVQMAVQEAA